MRNNYRILLILKFIIVIMSKCFRLKLNYINIYKKIVLINLKIIKISNNKITLREIKSLILKVFKFDSSSNNSNMRFVFRN